MIIMAGLAVTASALWYSFSNLLFEPKEQVIFNLVGLFRLTPNSPRLLSALETESR
jgi:hypothetical protein